jgi:hypothetical protein
MRLCPCFILARLKCGIDSLRPQLNRLAVDNAVFPTPPSWSSINFKASVTGVSASSSLMTTLVAIEMTPCEPKPSREKILLTKFFVFAIMDAHQKFPYCNTKMLHKAKRIVGLFLKNSSGEPNAR